MEEFKESKETRELKSEIAQQKPRDEDGHFIHVDKPIEPQQIPDKSAPIAQSKNIFSRFFQRNSVVSGTTDKDTLIDVHVRNPFKWVTDLIEEIKKQKAFNFTVKGSLGIMGVFLTMSVFGIFGGGQILCDKGTQVEIGTVKQLQVLQEDPASGIPILSQFRDYFRPKQKRQKFVLIKSDESVIQLPFSRTIDLTKFANQPVIATGTYNACNQTLTVNDPSAIEFYFK